MSLTNILANRGGNVEFCWHVGGMPYAYCTSGRLAAALAALCTDPPDTKIIEMFGAAQINSKYICKDIVFFPGLYAPGMQSFKLHDSWGKLDGGEFEIVIDNADLGQTWTHRTGSSMWGAEGIHIIPTPSMDSTICESYLYDNFLIADEIIHISHDTDGRLKAKVDACVDPAYALIWIGSECIAVDHTHSSIPGYPSDVVGLEGDGSSPARGVYRSKEQSFYVEDYESTNVMVSDAPIGGIAGRGSYLWAVVMDGSSIVGDPVLVRHGQCTSAISHKGGKTNIKCLPWQSWLEAQMPTIPAVGHLAGYALQHNAMAAAPISVWDVNPADGSGAWKQLWLSDTDNWVYFSTWEELKEAINKEFEDMAQEGDGSTTADHASDGTFQLYKINDENRIQTGGDAYDKSYRVAGLLTYLCGLGFVDENDMGNFDNWLEAHDYRYIARSSDSSYCWPNGDTADDNPVYMYMASSDGSYVRVDEGGGDFPADHREYCVDAIPLSSDYRAQYIYAYRYETQTGMSDFLDPSTGNIARVWNWPISYHEAPVSNPGFYLDNANDVEYFETGFITMGDDTTYRFGKFYGKITIDDPFIEAYDTDDDVRAHDCDNYDIYYPNGTKYAAIGTRKYGASGLDVGQPLTYIPAKHESDPWIVNTFPTIQSVDMSDIYLGILGDTTNGNAYPKRFRIDMIPDGYNGDGAAGRSCDHKSSIDWTTLSASCKAALQGLDCTVYYSLPKQANVDFLTMLRGDILFHGLRPTWEYNTNYRQFWMSFAPIGLINKSRALVEGRVINSGNRKANDVPAEVYSNAWLFNKLRLRCNWDSYKAEFRATVSVENKWGRSMQAGKDRTLEIDAYCLHIEALADDPEVQQKLSIYLGNLLKSVMFPTPTISCTLSIDTALKQGLGRECLVTDTTAHNPYTGQLGLTSHAGLITEKGEDWNAGLVKVSYIVGANGCYGWGPAIRVTASSKPGGAYVLCSTIDANSFSDSTWGRSDLSYFDCVDHNPATDAPYAYISRNCSCGNYNVIAYEEGLDCVDITQDLQFTMSNVTLSSDGATDTCRLVGANVASWDTAKTYIVVFNYCSSIQECQENFIYFAGDDEQLLMGSDYIDGRRWQ